MLGLAVADIPTFRPNIVINEEYDEPYCEDEFQEMRIGNIMLRQLGPCKRCKTTSLIWRLNMRHPLLEPYTTICKIRKHHKFGPIFGTYIQPDIIETSQQFKELLPDHDEITDRPYGEVGIIRQGDIMHIRERKRTYYLN